MCRGLANQQQGCPILATMSRLVSTMAEGLGVSIQGVAEGTGMLGRKGVEAVGQAGKGLGGAIGGLFGGPQTK